MAANPQLVAEIGELAVQLDIPVNEVRAARGPSTEAAAPRVGRAPTRAPAGRAANSRGARPPAGEEKKRARPPLAE